MLGIGFRRRFSVAVVVDPITVQAREHPAHLFVREVFSQVSDVQTAMFVTDDILFQPKRTRIPQRQMPDLVPPEQVANGLCKRPGVWITDT